MHYFYRKSLNFRMSLNFDSQILFGQRLSIHKPLAFMLASAFPNMLFPFFVFHVLTKNRIVQFLVRNGKCYVIVSSL